MNKLHGQINEIASLGRWKVETPIRFGVMSIDQSAVINLGPIEEGFADRGENPCDTQTHNYMVLRNGM